MLLKVFSTNERAISCYEKVGYKQIGRWRNALEYGSERFDEIFMDCIPSELIQPWE
jgi:RimJ/RimL family protein N-acetyltransferase